MSETPALAVRDLNVALGRTKVVRNVSLEVARGAVVGVVGPNGAGKTTFVDAVTGFVPSSGTVAIAGVAAGHLRPHRRAALGAARTFQSLELFEDLTVGENLTVAADAAGLRLGGSETSLTGPLGPRTPAERVARAASIAGVDDVLDSVPGLLSHGRRKQVALARALASSPSVLLLDEPAAGLDGAERRSLQTTLRRLAAEGMAVVLVDHDMRLVFDVCDEVAVLDAGRVVAHGPSAEVRADPAVVEAWLGSAAPSSPPAVRPATDSRPAFVELAAVSTGWQGVPAVHDVDLTVAEGEMVALLGANGAGKTSTLLAVTGFLPVFSGEIRVAGAPGVGRPDRMARRGVSLAAQDRGVLGGLTVAEQLRLAAGGGAAGRSAIASTLDRLPRLRPLLGRRGRVLSGGEQQQVSLGRALAARPRLLLVDELSAGLAPVAVEDTLTLLRALADDGMAVLVVEQFAPLALAVADRAYVLQQGRVTLSGSAADLAARPEALEAAFFGTPPADPR